MGLLFSLQVPKACLLLFDILLFRLNLDLDVPILALELNEGFIGLLLQLNLLLNIGPQLNGVFFQLLPLVVFLQSFGFSVIYHLLYFSNFILLVDDVLLALAAVLI